MSRKRSRFHNVVVAELARAGLCQRDLARRLQVIDTTLSGWLTEQHRRPDDLPERIERALRLPLGSLTSAAESPHP